MQAHARAFAVIIDQTAFRRAVNARSRAPDIHDRIRDRRPQCAVGVLCFIAISAAVRKPAILPRRRHPHAHLLAIRRIGRKQRCRFQHRAQRIYHRFLRRFAEMRFQDFDPANVQPCHAKRSIPYHCLKKTRKIHEIRRVTTLAGHMCASYIRRDATWCRAPLSNRIEAEMP